MLADHFTHHVALLLAQGPKLLSLMSDPFGWGWGWGRFGTARRYRAPCLPEPGALWHLQVGTIVLGHVLGVWLAHREALRVFGARPCPASC